MKTSKPNMKTINLVKALVDYVPHTGLLSSVEEELFSIVAKFPNVKRISCPEETPLSNHMRSYPGGYDLLDGIIVIKHKNNTSHNTLVKNVLIGKGIIFDTGGLNIKTGNHMYGMHSDKAGAAAVIGAINDLPQDRQSDTVGIIGFRINLPGQIYPGRVLISAKGKKVEVVDTDAEGRLLLADLIESSSYRFPHAENYLTIATLTGAAANTGSRQYALLMSDRDTKEKILKVGLQFLEQNKIMIMPDFPDCKVPMSKRVRGALSNYVVGDKQNHANQGYLFIKEFVPSKVKLLHLDIAGVATDLNERSTAYGTIEIIDLLSAILKNS